MGTNVYLVKCSVVVHVCTFNSPHASERDWNSRLVKDTQHISVLKDRNIGKTIGKENMYYELLNQQYYKNNNISLDYTIIRI